MLKKFEMGWNHLTPPHTPEKYFKEHSSKPAANQFIAIKIVILAPSYQNLQHCYKYTILSLGKGCVFPIKIIPLRIHNHVINMYIKK